ncbi:MAG TPA: hypothetical protein VGK54_04355, partial [Chloroflexota bacterium]
MRDRVVVCLGSLLVVIPTLFTPAAALAGVPPELVTVGASDPIMRLPSPDVPAEVQTPQADVTTALLSSDRFQLAMPFRTQKDGDRFQGANCGPAALGMVLQAFGIYQSNQDLRYRSQL